MSCLASIVPSSSSSSSSSSSPSSTPSKPTLTTKPFYHLLDTRKIWLDDSASSNPSSIPSNVIATSTVSSATTGLDPLPRTKISAIKSAERALSFLSEAENEKAVAFYFLKDAKLSVGSSLLKRRFVCEALGTLGRDEGEDGRVFRGVDFERRGGTSWGKPCFGGLTGMMSEVGGRDAAAAAAAVELDFNVSHQAGIVVLAGFSHTFPNSPTSEKIGSNQNILNVGIDITCTSERRTRDLESVQEKGRLGFEDFVDVHEDVFSPKDVIAMKAPIMEGLRGGWGTGMHGELEKRFRRFYAYWALKEAYVKMEGEALLAGWLREVEFRRVRVPEVGGARNGVGGKGNGVREGKEDGADRYTEAGCSGQGRWGECVEGIEVWLRGKRREGVKMFLQAFEQDYLIATAVLIPREGTWDIGVPVWQELELEKDILPSR